MQIAELNIGRVRYPLDDPKKITDIMAMINDGRLECGGFEVRRSNLEEVFLNLTGSMLIEDDDEDEKPDDEIPSNNSEGFGNPSSHQGSNLDDAAEVSK